MDYSLLSIPSENGIMLEAELRGDKTQPVLILFHGLASDMRSKTAVSLDTTLDDMAMLRVNLHCHGKSGGTQLLMSQAIADAKSTIRYAQDLGFTRIGLYGSSLGGKAAIHAASQIPVDYLALKCAAASYKMEDLGPHGKAVAAPVMRGHEVPYPGSGGTIIINRTFYDDAIVHDAYLAAKDVLCPTLLVHGYNDLLIPKEQCLELRGNFPDARLMLLSGADHSFKVPAHYDEMIDQLTRFIRRFSRESKE